MSWSRTTALTVPVLFLTACAASIERSPVPRELVNEAQVPGLPDVREWGDVDLATEHTVVRTRHLQETIRQLKVGETGDAAPTLHWLAISGGAADGAFGAGLLVGWSDAGTRPRFDLVTGVSTGALTAPFAFLGSERDAELEHFYTTITDEQLFEKRGLLKIITGVSAVDTSPLRELLSELVDAKMLASIAREHAQGRRLFVATTNLDAQRPVFWDMGSIAAAGTPESLELFRDVLLASASVPGLFPPVLIQVEAGGKKWDEMHVDGGAANQVALVPETIHLRQVLDEQGFHPEVEAYVLRNARTTPEWQPVEPKIAAIFARSMLTLTKMQGIGDLYRMYLGCLRDGFRFHLAMIPADFEHARDGEFDPVYMRALFDHARAMARAGFPWESAPPRFEAEAFERALAPAAPSAR